VYKRSLSPLSFVLSLYSHDGVSTWKELVLIRNKGVEKEKKRTETNAD
jgi:hypothetical protein